MVQRPLQVVLKFLFFALIGVLASAYYCGPIVVASWLLAAAGLLAFAHAYQKPRTRYDRSARRGQRTRK